MYEIPQAESSMLQKEKKKKEMYKLPLKHTKLAWVSPCHRLTMKRPNIINMGYLPRRDKFNLVIKPPLSPKIISSSTSHD